MGVVLDDDRNVRDRGTSCDDENRGGVAVVSSSTCRRMGQHVPHGRHPTARTEKGFHHIESTHHAGEGDNDTPPVEEGGRVVGTVVVGI
jgi:hypothetical protein